jgi:hypothetical protein
MGVAGGMMSVNDNGDDQARDLDLDQTDRVRAELEKARAQERVRQRVLQPTRTASAVEDFQHDPEAAVDFLTWAYPEGPWCLTAIEVDSPQIKTATFFPKTAETVKKFMQDHARWNLYWSVNRPMTELSKKVAEKTDIAAAHFLHVDVNMRNGEARDQEHDRILTLFSSPPAPIPQPTAVIFSGGGYQGLWRLAEPFVIDGDVGKAEEIESYNRQLEWAFGTEACHNVDRILRLVGSVNFPSAKKRGKGRRIERAVLV